jgi:transcription antitermination protein NusB
MPNTENITNSFLSGKILKRRAARIMAIQCFYSINIDKVHKDNTDEKISDILYIYDNKLVDSKLSKVSEGYFIFLVRSCLVDKEKIIELISLYLSEDWKFVRLGKVIQAILMIAVTEILNKKSLDPAILISEYLEITKFFNHGSEVGFVNGLLDKITKNRSV